MGRGLSRRLSRGSGGRRRDSARASSRNACRRCAPARRSAPLTSPERVPVAADHQRQAGRRQRCPDDVVATVHAATADAERAAARRPPASHRWARRDRRHASRGHRDRPPRPSRRRASARRRRTTLEQGSSRAGRPHQQRRALEAVEARVVTPVPTGRTSSTSTPSTCRPRRPAGRRCPIGQLDHELVDRLPAAVSRISMPTTSPCTAPMRLATAPSAPGRSGSHSRST